MRVWNKLSLPESKSDKSAFHYVSGNMTYPFSNLSFLQNTYGGHLSGHLYIFWSQLLALVVAVQPVLHRCILTHSPSARWDTWHVPAWPFPRIPTPKYFTESIPPEVVGLEILNKYIPLPCIWGRDLRCVLTVSQRSPVGLNPRCPEHSPASRNHPDVFTFTLSELCTLIP